MDNKYRKDEKECYSIISWISQIILWIYFIYIFFTGNINYIIITAIYGIYLLVHIFLNHSILLLYYSINLNTLFTKLFFSPLEISFSLYNNFINYFDVRLCKKVIECLTKKEKYIFPYYSCKDISGLIVLKTPSTLKNIKFLQVKIYLLKYMIDDFSRKDYNDQNEKYSNKYIDKNLINKNNSNFIHTDIYIKNYKFSNSFETLIKLEDKSYIYYLVNVYLYIFFQIICLGSLYNLFIFRYIMWAQTFVKRENIIIIRKIISTRYNLGSMSKKLEKLNPLVNYNGKFYFFDKEKSVYVRPDVIPRFADTEESEIKQDKNRELKHYCSEQHFKHLYDELIDKGEEFKNETKTEKSLDLSADYFIKVNHEKNQFSIS